MKLFLIVFGLSSGIMVGAGVIALLILVGIIPRMAQITKTKSFINYYEKILVIGTLLGSLISIQNISISIGRIGVALFFNKFIPTYCKGEPSPLDLKMKSLNREIENELRNSK